MFGQMDRQSRWRLPTDRVLLASARQSTQYPESGPESWLCLPLDLKNMRMASVNDARGGWRFLSGPDH